jgi:hypothetical protein
VTCSSALYRVACYRQDILQETRVKLVLEKGWKMSHLVRIENNVRDSRPVITSRGCTESFKEQKNTTLAMQEEIST